MNGNVDWADRGLYATRAFTDRAVNIIRQHDKSGPLFLYMSHLAVHTGSSEGDGLEVPADLDVDGKYAYIRSQQRRRYAGDYPIENFL